MGAETVGDDGQERPIVGFVGVGLMGWGMAKNVVESGFPLRVVAYRKREAVEDLVRRGAVELGSIAEIGAQCDVVVLCVTGAPQVEAVVAELLTTAQPGCTIIDASTSDPAVTARLHRELAEREILFIDAPLSRTPQHAWDGELTTYIGGQSDVIEEWRPLIETWATVIIPTGGPVGSAHAVKLITNVVGIGYAALWSECYGMCRSVELEPAVLHAIITNSGLNCGNFQNYSKYVLEGDPDAHRFSLSNCLKDLTYYNRMATAQGTATLMSDGALQMLKLGVNMGMAERNMPEMGDIVLRLNGEDGES